MISINSNIQSIMLNRSMTQSTSAIELAMQRMSTGYRINSAKDDAAGMAVSDKLNRDISAYTQLNSNAQMGMNYLKVADGGLNNIKAMLNRIRDLATQGANGTYGDNSRNAMEKEVDALTGEIQRQLDTTEFNGKKIYQEEKLIQHVETKNAVPAGYIGIYTADDLQKMNNNKAGKYILMSDIDLEEVKNWTPIGESVATHFRGTFDGNGHTIKNLEVKNSSSDYQGLFGYVRDATIQNVIFENPQVEGQNYVGALAGFTHTSTITNVAIKNGKVYAQNNEAGGLTGRIQNSQISDCYAQTDVKANNYAGGLVGQTMADNTILRSFATGNVEVVNNYGGGLVGRLSSNTSNCYATGNVNGSGSLGGFAGGIVGTGITIKSCYSTGDVGNSTSTAVGGFVGYVGNGGGAGTIENCYSKGIIKGTNIVGGLIGHVTDGYNIRNCYTTSKVDTTSTSYVGGLLGRFHNGIFFDSFFDTDKTGKINGIGGNVSKPGISGKTTTEMLNPNTYTNWDKTTWNIENGSYPTLNNMSRVNNDTNLKIGLGYDKNSFITFDTSISLDDLKIDLSTSERAAKSLKEIDKMLNKIIDKQANFGAVMNRLSSIMDYQTVAKNNLTGAMSTIKDADIAQESSNFIRSQILQKSASMLMAQSSNSQSQMALSLIKNATKF